MAPLADSGKSKAITLIGMPGSGKSTLGVQLAKLRVMGFVDTDLLLQQAVGMSLQAYINQHGAMALREREAETICAMPEDTCVIATGGSAVYSEAAMAHLRSFSTIVHLHVDLPTMRQRVGDFSQRGITLLPGMTLEAMFAEREALYRQHADITIDTCQAMPLALAELQAHTERLNPGSP